MRNVITIALTVAALFLMGCSNDDNMDVTRIGFTFSENNNPDVEPVMIITLPTQLIKKANEAL